MKSKYKTIYLYILTDRAKVCHTNDHIYLHYLNGKYNNDSCTDVWAETIQIGGDDA
jgi:hypothetical protein